MHLRLKHLYNNFVNNVFNLKSLSINVKNKED